RIDLILDGGGAALGIESTVLDLVGPRPLLLRRGAVTREALAEALGEVDVAASEDEASRRSPGLRHRHYAPRCRVTLAPAGAGLEVALALRDQHGPRDMIGLMVRGPAAPPPPGVLLRSLPEALEGYAGALFAALRELEGRDVAAIVVEEVPEEGLGAAIMDRLRRAAAG
ncbi:MAG: L-threonylcarbamoyladenylate synthase, partial [Myxococcales bacterium]|nr:L-threonylcarbamoyladenylate synthase [Myxococcales bacterium]